MKKVLPIVVLISLTAGLANAEVVVEWKQLGSPGYDRDAANLGDMPAGFTSWDMLVTTDTNWLWSALVVETAPGGIYQDPTGTPGADPPNPFFFGFVPSLRFDSYVNKAGDDFGSAGHSPSVPNPAGGPDLLPAESDSQFIQAWFSPPGSGAGTFPVARLTLADGAEGQIWFAGRTQGAGGPQEDAHNEFMILNGAIVPIPEPASMVLLILGAIGIVPLLRRRKK